MQDATLYLEQALVRCRSLSEFAEKYPDIYFAHGSGYMSNGKNFTNYFGRIYQARYLSRHCRGSQDAEQ